MPVKTGYPRIRLDCPHGHSFWSAAGPGCTVKCPECLRAGNRVSVRMPSARPRNQRELTAWESQNAEREVSLSDKWDSVSPWDETILLWAPDDHSGVCSKCGKPMSWERARTVVCCPDCRVIDLAPNVGRYYAEQAEHKKEITRPQRSKTRQAKVEFGRLKREKIRVVESWIIFYSHSKVPQEYRDESFKVADLFREYVPFIRDSGDDAELNEILSELFQLWRDESGPELRDAIRDAIRDARLNVIQPDETETSDQESSVSPADGDNPYDSLRARMLKALPAGNGYAGLAKTNPADSFWSRYDIYVTQQARNSAIIRTQAQTRKCHYCSRIANRVATFQRNRGTLMRYVCDSCQITAVHDGGTISLALYPEDRFSEGTDPDRRDSRPI